MPIKSFIFIIIFCFLGSCADKKVENPTVGKWSTDKSCHAPLLLSSNYQISGQDVIGTWEERKDFTELNIAKKSNGQYIFVQVLVTKPSAQKMTILQIVFPEQTWSWPQKIGDTLYKCK